jgi:hypothetical protein
MNRDYFDESMVNQMRLRWTIATRRQLERWEPIVASFVRDLYARPRRSTDGMTIWSAWMEHHFALVAAAHLMQALDLSPASRVSVDPTLRAEVVEGRHLHEHWLDNMPVFNVNPPPSDPPRPSGKAFAKRNPKPGNYPYWWLGWSAETGARLLPHVSAPALHQVLDAVEKEVLADVPDLSPFVPPRAPSPWAQHEGQWWPKPE